MCLVMYPRPEDRTLSDRKDVQAGSNGLVIKWTQLSVAQQQRFQERLFRGITWLRQPTVLEFLLTRNNAFNEGAREVLLHPELVLEYGRLIQENLVIQEQIYARE